MSNEMRKNHQIVVPMSFTEEIQSEKNVGSMLCKSSLRH